MKQFEPPVGVDPVGPAEYAPGLDPFSNSEILLEARRHGLLIRVQVEHAVPVQHASQFSIENQIRRAFMDAADEAAHECLRTGKKPVGMEVFNGRARKLEMTEY